MNIKKIVVGNKIISHGFNGKYKDKSILVEYGTSHFFPEDVTLSNVQNNKLQRYIITS